MTSNHAQQPAAVAQHDEIPDTDDPAILRELLRQAHEQLRLHRSFDQLIAENAARSEALLAETNKARRDASTLKTAEARQVIASLRQSLNEALSGIDRLERLLAPQSPTSDKSSPSPTPEAGTAHRIDVLIHPVTSPSLARSAQQHLAAIDGVVRAEVRELAEGLLRITVEGNVSISGDTFAEWEPERPRSVRNANSDAIEISLEGDN